MKDTREYQTKVVADNIRRLRDKLGLNQAELAFNADISSVAMYESKKRYPEPDKLARIAKALGVTVSELTRDPSDSSEHADMQEQIKEQIQAKIPLEQKTVDFVFEILEENKLIRSELETLKNHPVLVAFEKATRENQDKALALLESKPPAVDDIEKRAQDLLRQADEALGRTPARKKDSQ